MSAVYTNTWRTLLSNVAVTSEKKSFPLHFTNNKTKEKQTPGEKRKLALFHTKPRKATKAPSPKPTVERITDAQAMPHTLSCSHKSPGSCWSPTQGTLRVGTALRAGLQLLFSSQASCFVLLTSVLKRNTAVLAGHAQGRKAISEIISAKAS